MPTYKTTREKFASTVTTIEKKGELVISTIASAPDEFIIVTRAPEDTTGRPWLPSKETR